MAMAAEKLGDSSPLIVPESQLAGSSQARRSVASWGHWAQPPPADATRKTSNAVVLILPLLLNLWRPV